MPRGTEVQLVGGNPFVSIVTNNAFAGWVYPGFLEPIPTTANKAPPVPAAETQAPIFRDRVIRDTPAWDPIHGSAVFGNPDKIIRTIREGELVTNAGVFHPSFNEWHKREMVFFAVIYRDREYAVNSEDLELFEIITPEPAIEEPVPAPTEEILPVTAQPEAATQQGYGNMPLLLLLAGSFVVITTVATAIVIKRKMLTQK